jgi:hypothetical protein
VGGGESAGERGGTPSTLPPPQTPFSPPHSINTFLDNVDVGDYIVTGELEAYSCKREREREGEGEGDCVF